VTRGTAAVAAEIRYDRFLRPMRCTCCFRFACV